ncbi:hypothetical protein G647_04068 [Cladophialophora carrionii CBS 160.54]|uniref:Uncharacterized protein n=1 Tax=Cladophialophora carrionii CBS 160.54 TaxID=1279043 RepID=V9DCS1_9EURO|nr:uncharacterized protein G647_04068 [Cladophialophora carrionii CBS 160.54]ETI24699.1 hypothetical protein G647_04068 [Cladophialophora carrionii CBS 160.54]
MLFGLTNSGHPLRLVSQHTLAGAYKANGRVKDAMQLLEEVVRIEQTLPEDESARLASQHELARAYEANGQIKDAVRLLEEVVRIEQTLAEDGPARLASEHELARLYRANGQTERAIKLLEEVVRIQQTLPEDNTRRLAFEHNLALCLWELGQHFPALEMMRHVVETSRRGLDPDHPNRIGAERALEYFEEEYLRGSSFRLRSVMTFHFEINLCFHSDKELPLVQRSEKQ